MKVSKDKLAHLILGAAVTTAAGLLWHFAVDRVLFAQAPLWFSSLFAGASAATLAALARELANWLPNDNWYVQAWNRYLPDKLHAAHSGWSWADVGATCMVEWVAVLGCAGVT